MLGANIDGAGWPACGEIDVMENMGKEPRIVRGTLHGPGYSGAGRGISSAYISPTARPFTDDFHVFSVDWSAGRILFFVDGNRYAEVSPSSLPQGTKWVFDHPFFILLNVAVGGEWPGNPDNSSVFPQSMSVDWVRVWKREEAPGKKAE
jgi:beta-glucanase (GH16 family)